MSEIREIRIPDLGTDDQVDVVEVLVSSGDRVAVDDGLVTLESDKASMDVPSPEAGVVQELALKKGDRVKEGDLILTLRLEPAQGSQGEKRREEGPRTDVDEARGEEARGERPSGGAPPRRAGQNGSAEGGPAREPAEARGDFEGVPEAPTEVREAADLHAEVLVLGAGPGGYTAAFRAADLGKKVVLVERYPALGGVCLNVGCIPSKALLHVAEVIEGARDLREHGVAFSDPEIDLAKLRVWKRSVVDRLTGGLSKLAQQRKVTVLQGSGTITSPHTLSVASDEGEKTVSFDALILAAGSRPTVLPGLPDDPRIMDSTGALALEGVPKRLLLVGGGIIGLEMAMVYGSLGSELTVVELLDGLIPGCDRDLVRPLQKRLEQRFGASIHLRTKVAEIKAHKKHLKVLLEGEGAPGSILVDRALVAVGRRPNSDRIGLGAIGLQTDDKGFLPVDAQQRTRIPHIFAIGDLTGEPLLAHKATHQGRVAAEVAAGQKSGFDARVIPSVAYTDPEIAWVGLTETEAKKNDIAYERGHFPWAASGRSLGMGRDEGLTKILFDPETRRVLGAGIVGPGAGDLIAELALAIEMDCEAADLALTIHPHPTLSETVGFAAESFEGTLTDLYLPRRGRKRR